MTWIRPLSPGSSGLDESADVVGAKGRGLMELQRLGLPVPAGFVITTDACRAYLRDGCFPEELREELAAAVADLETRAGRRFTGTPPLAVSVRSGASVSMPGMMNTILNLGLTTQATADLAAETGDPRFAYDSRLRFLSTFGSALTGGPVPDDATEQLVLAVEAVFGSWNTARARTYRELHGIDHDLGTAVVVQAMVFGNRDDRSGTGVAFSRDPTTGEDVPFGDVLFARQGEDVVAGRERTHPLQELGEREPAVSAALVDALRRLEAHYRDAVYVEFTYQSGELWLLQVRPGRFTGAAAVRLAIDLAEEQVITHSEALLGISPRQLRLARTARIAASAQIDLLARGVGASPGVAVGAVATTVDAALRLAPGGDVILARPETSPNDINGLAAATGIITTRGGGASHAAVVARSMGKPAVVGIADLAVDDTRATITAAGRTIDEGTVVTIDAGSGLVAIGRPPIDTGAADAYVGRLLAWADEVSGDGSDRDDVERLQAAHAALRAGNAH